MSRFTTDLVYPSKYDAFTFFYKVLMPSLGITIVVAFFRGYYVQNGYDVPFLLKAPLILLLLVACFALFFAWYYNTYKDTGRIALTEDSIEVDWQGANKARYSFPVKDLTNISIVYDGVGGIGSNAKGTENRLMFAHDGNFYDYNFLLPTQEDAEKMGEVMKSWYANNVRISEVDAEGNERYLMLYNPKHKPAVEPLLAAQQPTTGATPTI